MNDITLPLMGIVTLGTILASAAASYAVTKRLAENAEKKAERVEKDLAEFKIESTRRFVTYDVMSSLEERIVSAINKIADRMDRMLESRIK
jgi:hypothetical protein